MSGEKRTGALLEKAATLCPRRTVKLRDCMQCSKSAHGSRLELPAAKYLERAVRSEHQGPPPKSEMERIHANGVGISRVGISLVDFETTKRRTRGDSKQFCGERSTSQTRWQRGEFELYGPSPVRKVTALIC
jgi:hypothetical protein